MTVPVARSLAVVILASSVVSVGAALTGAILAAQAPEPTAPAVYVAEVDSIIHPVSAEYMTATLAEADRANATLVVFTLRTPGGLVLRRMCRSS